ncbi:MAG: heparin/heparin-sulfate lyase HepB [Planctomycetota bacterium]
MLGALTVSTSEAAEARGKQARAEKPAAPPSGGTLQWKDAQGTKIPVPPAGHPRLYLRKADAAKIAARLKDPVLEPVIEQLQSLARRSKQFDLEWRALLYLTQPDAARGRTLVEDTLAQLKKVELADKKDACRETGRWMVTGAMVYDWLYPLLSAEQKQAYIREFIRLAHTLECGYPPTRQGSVTGHSSEAMIMRDMLSAGIAIYDEHPEMYELAAGRFFREHLPARNWLYEGHAYHQGDSYGVYRYGWDTFPLWIFDRLGAGNVFNPQQQFVPYHWVYATRPDGQRIRAGDTFSHSTRRGEPWPEHCGTLLTASYYGDGRLLDQFVRHGGVRSGDTIFEFLWRDTELKPQPITDLPLSRYFGGPYGWMIARTGWGNDAAIAEMKINAYNFSNHQHLDAGAFQLYYKGSLAVDSGIYKGSSGQYGSDHCRNYFWRTIAHNSLLIYDASEDFGAKRGYGNDGGQRLPNGRSEPRTLDEMLTKGYRTGEVLAHGFGPEAQSPRYTLLEGDITDAYSDKVRQVRRSFVFLNLGEPRVPAALVVFDRVVSSNPDFKKFWLLHSQEEPSLISSGATVDCTQHGDRGRLELDVLLPPAENLELTKVGGPGKEYWVFGTNHANDVSEKEVERGSIELGNWRIEVSPKKPAAEDEFLTVMQVTDRLEPGKLAVSRVEDSGLVGCRLQGEDGFWQVMFSGAAGPNGASDVSFQGAGEGQGRYLITGLAPGRWMARHEGGKTVGVEVSADARALWVEGPSGRWTAEQGR